MRLVEGLVLLAIAAAMLMFGKARGNEARPMFANWLLLIIYTMAIEAAFVSGAAALITALD